MCDDIKCNSCGSSNITHYDDGSIVDDEGKTINFCDVKCEDCGDWN
jgi:hypothetical protein